MNDLTMHDMKRLFVAVGFSAVMILGASAASSRSITKVETVSVEVPVGNAPRLPYQLWVTYADGKGEYRTVKWTNTSLDVEQEQADGSRHPVGSTYQVRGFIVGDNTTANGFPVKASISVVEGETSKVPSNIPIAQPLPLDKVLLTGENRLTHNRDLDIDNLLTLDQGTRHRALSLGYGHGLCQLSGQTEKGVAAESHQPHADRDATLSGAHFRVERLAGPLFRGTRRGSRG